MIYLIREELYTQNKEIESYVRSKRFKEYGFNIN